MGDKTFGNYFKRLAGEKVMTHDGDPDCGFYRKPIRNGRAEGNQITGWQTVAYFMADGAMVGVIGDRDMSSNEIPDLWTYVCAYPVPEDIWKAIDEKRMSEWPRNLIGEPKQVSRTAYPDPVKRAGAAIQEALDTVPAANRVVERNDNAPVEEVPAHQQHADAIDTAIADPVGTVISEEQASALLGRKNRVAELRLAADKAGKAIYQPPYNTYKAAYALWTPPVARADAFEKKANTAILTFRENERKRLKKIADDEAEAARLVAEAAARAADRAIARGEPEPAPVAAPVSAPVIAQAPLAPTYGTRSVREQMSTFLDKIVDQDAVYQYFKNDPKVIELLTTLAAAKIKVNITVPGTTTREGLI